MAWHSWHAAPKAGLEGFGLPQLSERLKSLKGASGSFGPVEKERLGVSQLAALRARLEGFGGFEAFEGSIRQFWAIEKERRGLPQPIVWQLQVTVWQVSEGLEGLEGLKGLKGASGSFGPVEKERLGVAQLAAPRAPRAGFEGCGGFEL